MVRLASDDTPTLEKANLISRHKSNATNAATSTVDKAMAVAGG